MRFYFHHEADRELLELDKVRQKVVREFVEEFKSKGMNFKNFGRLTDEKADIDCFRIKVKQEEPVDINQRIIISVIGQQFIAYGVEHREKVYSKNYLEEIKDRMY